MCDSPIAPGLDGRMAIETVLRCVKRGWEFESRAEGGAKITHRAEDGSVLGVLELNLEEWLDVLEHLIQARRGAVSVKPPVKRGS